MYLANLEDGSVAAAIPLDEAARLEALRSFCILDSGRDQRFDRITRLASEILDMPVVLVSLVDAAREWFKSAVGTDLVEIKRQHGFCAHAILLEGAEPMIVADALADPRFATHPYVAGGPALRFYAGAPLLAPSGRKIGMLCVHDVKPRPEFGPRDAGLLAQFASIAMDAIEFHRIERERELLLGELSHRVKNVLSVVSSIAAASGRGDPGAASFVAGFQARIAALAAAHDRIVAGDWKTTALREIAESVLAAGQDGDRIALDLPDAALDAPRAQKMALVVHELLTNAIKHGALATAAGTVRFSATRAPGGRLAFEWRETGGPAVSPPRKRGFGHLMLDSVVRADGGKVAFDWQPSGMTCRFELDEPGLRAGPPE